MQQAGAIQKPHSIHSATPWIDGAPITSSFDIQACDAAATDAAEVGPNPTTPNPAPTNDAIAHCYEAYDRNYELAEAKRASPYDCNEAGRRAFREALPPLAGRKNIQKFIACVAQGMLMEMIGTREGTKFLYAAQVALSTFKAEKSLRKPGRPRRSETV